MDGPPASAAATRVSITWVLWVAVILAAPGPVHAERLPIRSYTTADGLAHDAVNNIIKDSRGFLWFCTAGGLSRFDGYAFRTFGAEQGLPLAAVNDLLETADGKYWVATDAGLIRFDPTGTPQPRVVHHPAPTHPAPMFTLILPNGGNRRTTAITDLHQGRDGTVWIGTGSGLHRLEQIEERPSVRPVEIGLPNEWPEQRIIADVVEDVHGTLWVGTPVGLYRRWPDGSSARYTLSDGLPGDFFSDLFVDHDGHLWAGTRTAGLFRLTADGTRRPPVADSLVTTADGLRHNWITQLFQTSDHRFWAGTHQGLVEFFPSATGQARRVRAYGKRNGMSHPYVAALAEDLGGNLWLGSAEAGAMKVARGGFTIYGDLDGIDGVNAIFEDRRGNLCFRGTVLGDGDKSAFERTKLGLISPEEPAAVERFGCFDGRQFYWFKAGAFTYTGWVREGVTLQSRSGEWWAGSQEGLFRFPAADQFASVETARPRAVYGIEHGLAALQVYRLFEDSHGDVWISTISSPLRGLSRWDHQTGRVRDLAGSPGLPSLVDDLARSYAEDAFGNVWLAFNSGLARYTNGRFRFFTASDGLPAGAILNMHLDQSDRLWLASERGGLIRVDDPGGERPTFVSHTTANGLSSNSLAIIAEDREGHLYVGGGHGLDRFDPETGRVRHFTVADGLTTGTMKAGFRDRHGVLWFGTTAGLARLEPSLDVSAGPPPILINGLRVSGIPQVVSARGELEMSIGDLAHNEKQLEIDFVGLGFGAGEVLGYQYRLDGADTDWGAVSQGRTVTYASLGPGRYTFLVRAVNADGITSLEPASIAFRILPPFWQRWWFIALLALAIGGAVQMAFQYRLARLLEVANMRTHIATDLHDDIGANLTRIALLSEVARRTEDDGALASIARIARESVTSMSDIVWAINPKRESVLDLTRRMRQHADELFTLRGIDLRFETPAGGAGLKLGLDVRRDLLLIFKEAVNNAARHSSCSAVDIGLRVERSQLVLSVTDNGVGFDPSAADEGHGLTSMRRRAARIKAAFEITSGPTGGTSVAVRVPL
jgi:ligand-binding sensor domain-containing protein/two-component sensor histidine kinase